jgi:hypothetical protein
MVNCRIHSETLKRLFGCRFKLIALCAAAAQNFNVCSFCAGVSDLCRAFRTAVSTAAGRLLILFPKQ